VYRVAKLKRRVEEEMPSWLKAIFIFLSSVATHGNLC
jgi:hypothetical protein